MKNILLLLALFIMSDSFGQGRQRKSPHDTLTYANGEVTYGRPHKSDREIFGALIKFGEVWRVGSDEATTISFKTNTKFGGETIPAGTYTMFALINEAEWTLILNSQLGQWGAFSYEKNKEKNIAKVIIPVEKLAKVVEQLTIWHDTDNGKLVIEWDTTRVSIPLNF
ncbi:MAG: DUF2911 domain-containing protein [Chitinophagaceae bacterium]